MRTTIQMFGLCVSSLLLLIGSASSQFTVDEMLVNGPTDQRINIVFLAEGYTESELSAFGNDAQAALDHFLSVEPLSNYENYFNAYRINVISNESGTDHPGTAVDCPPGEPVYYADTYFNSSFDGWDIHRLLTIPPHPFDWNAANGEGKVYDVLANHFPEYDIVALIVNSEEYGGSGGAIAIFSVHELSAEIAVHELGHSFAQLGDEYGGDNSAFNDPDNEPNTTKETIRELIKWNPWISPSTPIPTPETSAFRTVVGLFEGAHYCDTGWYRPKYECKMRYLGVEFCEVCQETWIVEIYAILDPILSYEPQQAYMTIEDGQSISFSVDVLRPNRHLLDKVWRLDGGTISSATGTSHRLNGSDLAGGVHTLSVEVTDPTDKVRNDPSGLLQSMRVWTVEKHEEPDILLSETGYDFGYVHCGASETWMLTISNTGNIDLEVTDISSDEPDFTPDPTFLTVPPGNSQDVTVTFTPSQVGHMSGALTVTSNDLDEPAVNISLSGTGSAATASLPRYCVPPGETAVVSIIVDNETWIDTPPHSAFIDLSFDDDLLDVVSVERSSRTAAMSIFEWDVPESGHLALNIADESDNTIATGTGSIAEINFAVSQEAPYGESTLLQFLGADMTDLQGQAFPVMLQDGSISFGDMVKGDANTDCAVDIVDALMSVNIFLQITYPTSQQSWAADCNGPTGVCDGDGMVDILDTLKIVNMILGLDACP